jgi:heme/copper-type cytochrome/quinol oxidase subunit 2
MAKNSAMDDVLSLISDDDSSTSTKQVSSQQSLRDRMLSESKSETVRKEHIQREEELSEEIIEEEEEEEYGTESKGKLGKIIIAIIVVLVLVVVGLFIFAGAGKKEEEVVIEEPPVEEAVMLEPVVEEVVIEETIFSTTYDMEQVQNLLAAGATPDQVSEWQKNGVDYNYVYFTMMDRYYGWQLTNTLPTYDVASDAYKDVIGQTWMSLPKRTDIIEWTEDMLAYEHQVRQNLDYEKVEPYGNQLFLKVYLDASTHDSWFFLNITPNEWNLLDDTGNVVVDYVYQTHWLPFENQLDAVEDEQNIFIVSAKLDIIESIKNIEDRRTESNTSSLID